MQEFCVHAVHMCFTSVCWFYCTRALGNTRVLKSVCCWLINYDVLLKKELDEVSLGSFYFFSHYPRNLVTDRKRCQKSEELIKFCFCLKTQLLLTSMKIKWTIIPARVYRSGQAAASHCCGLPPLQYYDCEMIVIFLSTKKSLEQKGCRLHILSD